MLIVLFLFFNFSRILLKDEICTYKLKLLILILCDVYSTCKQNTFIEALFILSEIEIVSTY